MLRDQLKQIGIDMTIKPVDVSVWYDAFVKGSYQITSAYQERTIDPDNFYSLVIKSGGPINSTGYSNNGGRCADRQGGGERRRRPSARVSIGRSARSSRRIHR